MTTMNAEQIESLVRPHLEKAGLSVNRIEVEGQDAPENHLPVVNAYVSLEGTNERAVVKAMEDAATDLSDEIGHDVAYGYFEREIDGVLVTPRVEAMLEFSDFPFTLEAGPTPGP